MLAVPFGSGA